MSAIFRGNGNNTFSALGWCKIPKIHNQQNCHLPRTIILINLSTPEGRYKFYDKLNNWRNLNKMNNHQS
jgi:hypothetical protein